MTRVVVASVVAALAIACTSDQEDVSDKSESFDLPSPTATQTGPSQSERSVVFTNTTYSYSVAYPAGWFALPDDAEERRVSEYVALTNYDPNTSPRGVVEVPIKIEIVVLPNDRALSLDAWLADYHASGVSEILVVSAQPIVVAGTDAIQEAWSVGSGDIVADYYTVFIPHMDRVYLINGPTTHEAAQGVYQEFLESFVFLGK